MTQLTQSKTVLKYLHAEGSEATYAQSGPEGIRRQEISRELWEELGRPETITVTIEPGNTLNEEGETDD